MNNVSAYGPLDGVNKRERERERERETERQRDRETERQRDRERDRDRDRDRDRETERQRQRQRFPFSPPPHPFLYLPLLTIPSSLSLPSPSHHPIITFYPLLTLPPCLYHLPSHTPFAPFFVVPSHTLLSLSLSSTYSHLTSLSTAPPSNSTLTPFSTFPFLPPTTSFLSQTVGSSSGCRRIDDYLTKRDGLVRDTGTHLQIVL